MASSSTIYRTFRILDKNVESSAQVFDSLIWVQDTSSEEKGWLLCSHYCRWPEELIPQATWLEGCYTPPNWKEDPRLALGYHPKAVTSWEVDYDRGEISLSSTISEDNEITWDDLSLSFQHWGYANVSKYFKKLRRFKAAWRAFWHTIDPNEDEHLLVNLCRFDEAIRLGRIDVPPFFSHYLYILGDREEYMCEQDVPTVWGDLDTEHIEYGPNGLLVITNNPSEGFLIAEPLPDIIMPGVPTTCPINEFNNSGFVWDIVEPCDALMVIFDYPCSGWATAEPLTLGEQHANSTIIHRTGGGYALAVPINVMSDGIVTREFRDGGYAVAIDL